MRKRNIPHDAIIFVGDGRKALFLRNDGDEKFANFVSERSGERQARPRLRQRPCDAAQRHGADRLA